MADRPASEELFDRGDYRKNYVLVSQLGSGTYGKVYKVQDKRTNLHVALKIIPVETGEELEEFMQEVTIMRHLNHPNIISMIAAWKKPKELAIAMEICECGSAQDLYTRVGYKPVPEPQIAVVARETLQALQYLHENLVMHRDIKAANILITASGAIKLTDFGVSCKLTSASERRNSLVGTPYWLAPEVHASSYTKLPYDNKIDIWSLAISLMELAETKAPLSDLPAANAIVEIPRRPPPKLTNPSLWSDEFSDFLALCLAKRPDSRPPAKTLLSHRWVQNRGGEADILAYVEKTKRGEWGPIKEVGSPRSQQQQAAQQPPQLVAQISPRQAQSHMRPNKRETLQLMREATALLIDLSPTSVGGGGAVDAYSSLGAPPPVPATAPPASVPAAVDRRKAELQQRPVSPMKSMSADAITPKQQPARAAAAPQATPYSPMLSPQSTATSPLPVGGPTAAAAAARQLAPRAVSPAPRANLTTSSPAGTTTTVQQPAPQSSPVATAGLANQNTFASASFGSGGGGGGAVAPVGGARLRLREMGVAIGRMAPGPFNAITDVAGVMVGHTTIMRGTDVRTGVTAILPRSGNMFQEKVNAAVHVANGFGKMMGVSQIAELGQIETPILLTSTLCVARVADALIDYMLALPGNERVTSINPIVAETNDGQLNDIRGRHITKDDVFNAITGAKGGRVDEGSVGAGAGTRCFSFKGGVGTSSRVLSRDLGGYTVGVFAQTNFGGSLTVAGVPVEADLMELLRGAPAEAREPPRREDGSCVIVVATNAPLESRNLERLAKRAVMGMARTGANFSNGSGDYAIAFSTAYPGTPYLANEQCSLLFEAAIEATEEAILNSLCKATTVVGKDGKPATALPLDLLLQILRKRRVLLDKN